MKLKAAILLLAIVGLEGQAGTLDFSFSNPSFSGIGYSSHVLSIEQLQYQREQGVADDKTAAEKAADRAAKNTTLAKFVTNVESRIFANLSKQMVDNMFGTNCTEDDDTVAIECPPDGQATLPDGSIVKWVRDDIAETITLTVIDAAGGITQLIVPIGDFKF
jgi:hypothetical protein